MAEIEQQSKARLPIAVLAGSALTFSSFAIGVPAAFADQEDTGETQEVTEDQTDGDAGNDTDGDDNTDESDQADDADEGDAPADDAGEDDAGDDDVAPSIGVDLDEVNPGDAGTVSGTGFSPEGAVTVTVTHAGTGTDVDSSEATADETGAFNTTFSIPEDADAGDYVVTATDEVSGESDTYDFNISDDDDGDDDEGETEFLTLDPSVTQAAPGDSIAVNGENATAGEDVALALVPDDGGSSIDLGNYPVDEDGTYQAQFAIPEEVTAGSYNLEATDAAANSSAAVPFTVVEADDEDGDVTEPTLSISPEQIELEDFTTGEEDTGVVHTIAGLEPGTSVSYVISGPEGVADFDSTVSANDEGVAEFYIYGFDGANPEVYLGSYASTITVEVEDGDDIELSGNFEVVDEVDEGDDPDPQLTLDQDEGQAGDTIGFTGTNFSTNNEVELAWRAAEGESAETDLGTLDTDEDGNIVDASFTVPEDAEVGPYEFVVRDEAADEVYVVDFTVVADDDDDGQTEQNLSIVPERIEVDDFVSDSDEDDDIDDDSGVQHTVDGLEPGTSIDYVVTAPGDIADYESTTTADEDGVADFTIRGADIEDNSVYIGDYETVVTFELEDEDPAELTGNFEVVGDLDEDPDVDLDIDLDVDSVYPGDSVNVTGSGFSADGDVRFELNPDLAPATADADGNIDADVEIPGDVPPDDYDFVAIDDETGERTSTDLTVLDPADADIDPSLSIDPERINVNDFIGELEDGAGVDHRVEGLEPGAEIDYVVAGPEGVSDYNSSAIVDDDGVAVFTIVGYETANPAVYLGDYTTVVTYVDEDGETDELQGSFSVVDGEAGTPGDKKTDGSTVDTAAAGYDHDDSYLAKTGMTTGQMAWIAAALVALGGAFMTFANRARLFGRKK